MEHLAALIGVILLGLAIAGVPDESAVALIVGGMLVLAPTVAAFAGPGRSSGDAGESRSPARE